MNENKNRQQTQAKKKENRSRYILPAALGCSFLGGLLGAGSMAAAGLAVQPGQLIARAGTIQEGQRAEAVLNVAQVNTSTPMTAAETYAANVSSTVGITTTSVTTNFFGYPTTAAASGSGFIYSDSGYIITNYHVIENADSIKVTTYENDCFEAELIGCDESSDLAVLKIGKEGIRPVILGDSDQMHVGDSVMAIGNPLGELTFSLTTGSVSALNREITIDGVSMNLIQTDCAINSGNSGGALFNTYGELIGITNAKYSSSSLSEASIDNIGFAIPINSVRSTIESIIENGTVSKPYIGVSISDISTDLRRFGISGLVVEKVEEDSPARRAGLKEDDVITSVNDQPVSSSRELVNAVQEARQGTCLKLTVLRQKETVEIEVTVEIRQHSALPEDKTREDQEMKQDSKQSEKNFVLH